jgi:hypothetical protein
MDEWPLVRSITSGERVVDEEYFNVLADGSRLMVRCSSAPIYDDGEIVGGLLVMEDITQQKRAKEERAYHARLVETMEDASSRHRQAAGDRRGARMAGTTRSSAITGPRMPGCSRSTPIATSTVNGCSRGAARRRRCRRRTGAALGVPGGSRPDERRPTAAVWNAGRGHGGW